MVEKLNRAQKKQITKEWNELFPSMGIYKNMWLMNILGPIVVGLILEVGSNTTKYTPIMHVHNLCSHSDVITILIPIEGESISTRSDSDKYKYIAEHIKAKSIVPFEADVELHSLIFALKSYCEELEYDVERCDVCDILIYLASWSGKESVIQEVDNFIKVQLGQGKLECITSGEQYINEMNEVFLNSKRLKSIVEQQITNLELQNIPRREIIVD